MNGLADIAGWTLRRSVRDRTFLLVGLLAPFLIMAALSATIGSALSGEYRPSLVIADETDGRFGDDIIVDLRSSGFDDVTRAASGDAARLVVERGDADAAVVIPRGLLTAGSPEPIQVIVDVETELAGEIASSIAEQLANTATTIRLLVEVDAPLTNLSGPITITTTAGSVGSSVLTDATYFAVGMSSFFAFFAAALFLASYHQERKQLTLARMLASPIGRLTPIVGKGIGVAVVTLISYAALVVASTVLLGANWGPVPGVAAIGFAMAFSAVAVAGAVVTLTKSEEAAAQAGIVVATGWAIFGGVFVEIPSSGPLATGAKLSPFTWALNGIGHNAGTGTLGEVLAHSCGIAGFGVVALIIVFVGRKRLETP